MQKRELILRWTAATLAIAVVCLPATATTGAALASPNPAAAAIASVGAGPVTSQSASSPTAKSVTDPTAATAAASATARTTAGAPVEATQPSRNMDAPELATLQSQLALWKARAEIAKYKAEVKRAEDSITSAPAGAPQPGGAPSISLTGPMPTGGASPRLSSDGTRLVSLRAFDGHYNATLDVDGRTVPVQAGDTLDGGWKVVSIDDAGVRLANGKRVRTLRP